jgi:hypothetical protein
MLAFSMWLYQHLAFEQLLLLPAARIASGWKQLSSASVSKSASSLTAGGAESPELLSSHGSYIGVRSSRLSSALPYRWGSRGPLLIALLNASYLIFSSGESISICVSGGRVVWDATLPLSFNMFLHIV